MTRPFDVGAWMWDEALTALDLAERRQRRFFALLGMHACEPCWEPPVDVFESADGLWIVVALPGVTGEEIVLRVETGQLVIQAVRAPRADMQAMWICRLEIPYGAFERRIELPAGRYTLRERRLADGCLELHLTRE